MDIQTLSKNFGVNAEVIKSGDFPVFFDRIKGRRVLVLTDQTTLPLSEKITRLLNERGVAFFVYTAPEREPALDEKLIADAEIAARGADYLLAVGAGTLNDLAKYVGSRTGKPSGVYATAPSMDGYTSGVAPVIEQGKKVTYSAQVASDILIDYELLCRAPKGMIGAGVGDILAKYCSLTDWKISALLNGEYYEERAATLMRDAVRACDACVPVLLQGQTEGVVKLMDALLISGYAMVIAGNSRPASGAEHHMSHYLEMDFLRRGKRIPLHGIKVGLGTAVSLYLYHTIKDRADFAGQDVVAGAAEGLPSPEYVQNILRGFGCPTRFSELDVPKDTVRNMLFEAYRIRDRYTILRLYCEKNLMKGAADEILDRYY